MFCNQTRHPKTRSLKKDHSGREHDFIPEEDGKPKGKGQKYCLRNTLASTWLMGCRKRKKPTQN